MAHFEFVNIRDPKEAKKHSTRVRRHVMMDIGKARRKPKAKPGGKDKYAADISNESLSDKRPKHMIKVSAGRERDMSGSTAREVTPHPEGFISHMVYPIEMSEDKLDLVRFLVGEAQYMFRPFRFAWLSTGLGDEAAHYITLAYAAAWRDCKLNDCREDVWSKAEVMRYYTLSLESIGKRLQGVNEGNDSEGLIAAITGCICHDASAGNFDRMAIHLKGLKRVIDKRGGLNKLNDPFLPVAISWLDLNAASFFDSKPHFVPPKVVAFPMYDAIEDSIYLQALLEKWDEQCPSLGDIMSAIIETARVANHINKHSEAPNFWQSDVSISRMIIPASYQILVLEGRALPSNPLDPRYSAVAARESFRRAAMIFLAMIKTRCQMGGFELARHVRAFREISRLPFVDWAVVPELNLWAHIIAAFQEDDQEEKSWHITVIVGIMRTIGLRSGKEALRIARGIIWVENIVVDKVDKLEREIDHHLDADRLSQQLEEIPLEA